ncbi:hypothetical protein ACFFX1_39470 [Dactylosporangium sucinum]|uniref:Uncharacterized protein n=1 Tax=Dactylosporangium sucinum TaxID=1424081 RepID=A0A917WFQ1_9ACTN|nr:hypothetical protein [Dactylosporangium sucinum]GGM03113.1 hypothetical protein GCM10007977_000610 [Dactylosporangium sucinum]
METLDDLDEAQLGQVLQHLVSRFDESDDVAITDEEVAAKVAADREFLLELAEARGVRPAAGGDLRGVVAALAAEVPDAAPVVDDAARQVRRLGTLPIGDLAGDILAIAAAAAILRPRLSVKKSNKGEDRSLEVRFDAGGIKSLDAILAAILRYLRQDGSG